MGGLISALPGNQKKDCKATLADVVIQTGAESGRGRAHSNTSRSQECSVRT